MIFANNQFVAVREGGAIMASPDGLTWTNQVSPTTNDLRALLWAGRQYLAAGKNGTVLTSPDGATWIIDSLVTSIQAGTNYQTMAKPDPLVLRPDSNRDGRISLLKLTRVIELYNYRAGQYHLQAGTEDGFNPGP